jgi:hypothetical protein
MPSGDKSDGEEDESEEMDDRDAAPVTGEEENLEDLLRGEWGSA